MGGQQSAPRITAQDRAVLDLKLQRDKLKQYQRGSQGPALVALRRRKYQEGLLVKTDGQLESLEQLVSTIEFSLVEVSVLHGLKQGNEVLKEIHKELNVEGVEKLLEETAEARSIKGCEIDNMLMNTLSLDDEDAVQEELKSLQQETVSSFIYVELEWSSEVASHAPAASLPQPERGTERVAIPA
ncbi:Snf7-domain-containing protein [Lactifluus volemus]|nr:Snf7-domain-containing protein [Lactifluus volemus]